jgi:hypothetical protein
VSKFYVAQVNQSCTPSLHVYGNTISFGSNAIYVDADGSFSLSWDWTGHVGPYPSIGHTSLQGQFSSSLAMGSLKDDASFTNSNGTSYTCSSGTVTWTAGLSS